MPHEQNINAEKVIITTTSTEAQVLCLNHVSIIASDDLHVHTSHTKKYNKNANVDNHIITQLNISPRGLGIVLWRILWLSKLI